MNNAVKMTFWISQGKVATSDRWGGQICTIFMPNFLGSEFFLPEIIKIGYFLTELFLKIIGGRFFGTTKMRILVIYFFNAVHREMLK